MKLPKTPFALGWDTPPAWAEDALSDPLALLDDHAHCELGATVASQGLIARVPEDGELVERLSAVAVEEMRHFRQVHRLLRSLGGRLGPVRKNPYAEGLVKAARGGSDDLLDRLLVAALIERRSLERFLLLADAPPVGDPRVQELFRELGPSEAGHAHLFVELAAARRPAVALERRLAFWIEAEAALIRGLEPGPRIHSGPPRAAVPGPA